MPLFHTADCGIGELGAAQRLAVHVPVLAFDPALVLELLETERAAVFGGAPTMMIARLGHPDFERRDLSALRIAVAGSKPVPADLVRRVESRVGVRFSIVFGTTECSPWSGPMPRPRTGPGHWARRCRRPRSRGCLVIRGYHDAPEATAAAIDAQGWYHTGDLASASIDGWGYLRIEGRIKDMIIRGGENTTRTRSRTPCSPTPPWPRRWSSASGPDLGEVVAALVRPVPGQPAPAPRNCTPGAGSGWPRKDASALGLHRRLPRHAVRRDPEVQAARELNPGTSPG